MISKRKLKNDISKNLIESHEYKTEIFINNLEFNIEVYDVLLDYEIIIKVLDYEIERSEVVCKDESTNIDIIIDIINRNIVEISNDFLGSVVEEETEDEIDNFFKSMK